MDYGKQLRYFNAKFETTDTGNTKSLELLRQADWKIKVGLSPA